MDSVRPDHDVGRDRHYSVGCFELASDVLITLAKANQLVSRMHCSWMMPYSLEQDRLKATAVYRELRDIVAGGTSTELVPDGLPKAIHVGQIARRNSLLIKSVE